MPLRFSFILFTACLVATLVTLGTANTKHPDQLPVAWGAPMQGATPHYERIDVPAANDRSAFTYFLLPPQNPSMEQSYPLVVLLHGTSRHMHGGRYYIDNDIIKRHPAYVLVPIAPPGMDWGSPEGQQNSAASMVRHAIELVRSQHRIDPARIYVSGYSMGGVGAFSLVLQYPDLFAAALVLCGQWDAAQASLFPDDLPIYALRGAEDHLLNAEPMIRALQLAGKPASYREYPGVGHNIWDYGYTDPAIWDWLFSQHKQR